MDMQLLKDGAAVGTVVGLVQLVKTVLPKSAYKWLSVVALGLGVGYSFLLRDASLNVADQFAVGIQLGLAAVGAFAATKNLTESAK